jgi:hypothetical protein
MLEGDGCSVCDCTGVAAGLDCVAGSVCHAVDEATGSGLRAVDGEGESTNMIDGPDASSGATAARGVGSEVNLGSDWCLTGGGLAR